ncbi:hypothetical protein B0H10DRAFT_1986731 [Mycena sp. CBHHK59/15]|nr:hypothetical protein B0H10DRAFT_1986731 [Mycena sp. CBHHK59/15]
MCVPHSVAGGAMSRSAVSKSAWTAASRAVLLLRVARGGRAEPPLFGQCGVDASLRLWQRRRVRGTVPAVRLRGGSGGPRAKGYNANKSTGLAPIEVAEATRPTS